MSGPTTIEWTDATWNCIRRCSRVSEGCRNCYAESIAARFSGPGLWGEGIATRNPARWTGRVELAEHKLTEPLRWRKPRRIFVNSMSDLFHESVPDEWIDRIMQTNVRGSFACIRAFRNVLEAGTNSCIINISSIAGRNGVGSNVTYCASKAAIDSMTRSLARALAPKIRVMSVAPGWVWGEYAARFPQDYIDEQIAKTPLNRIAQAEDVAEAVLTTAENLAFSTGSIIEVDGGRPLL